MNPDGQITHIEKHLLGSVWFKRLKNETNNGVDMSRKIEQLTRNDLLFKEALKEIFQKIINNESLHNLDSNDMMQLWMALQDVYLISPAMHRKYSVTSEIIDEDKRKLEINRRYLIGSNLCFSIDNTETSIPSEFIELEKGSAMFDFEDSSGFEYLGYKFNHIYVYEEKNTINFAAYTIDGDGPIRLQLFKDALIGENDVVQTKNINAAVSEIFELLREEIDVDEISGRVKDKQKNDFIFFYYHIDLDKIFNDIWSETPQIEKMKNSNFLRSRLESYARRALLNIAFDELGWLKKDDEIEDFIHNAQVYWTHAVSMCIKLNAIMSIGGKSNHQENDVGLKIEKIRPRQQNKKQKRQQNNKRILPFYRVKLSTNSRNRKNVSLARKPSQYAILVNGHTRRQPVKKLEKYPQAKKRMKRMPDGSLGHDYIVLIWIKPFWKNQESDEIGPEIAIVGTLDKSRSYAENAMGQIFTVAFGNDFIQDRTHDFITGPEGERFRLDGYLPNIKFAIEVDGEQHRQFIPHFHRNGEIDFDKQKSRDAWIREKCAESDVELVVIDDSQWDHSTEHLLEIIRNQISEEKFRLISEIIKHSQSENV